MLDWPYQPELVLVDTKFNRIRDLPLGMLSIKAVTRVLPEPETPPIASQNPVLFLVAEVAVINPVLISAVSIVYPKSCNIDMTLAKRVVLSVSNSFC